MPHICKWLLFNAIYLLIFLEVYLVTCESISTMNTTIQFKAKPETIYNQDNSVAYRRIKVPQFTNSHCNMQAFRMHPKYGAFANSDLFPGVLRRIRTTVFGEGRDYFRLDRIPQGVTVDETGFLAVVSFTV